MFIHKTCFANFCQAWLPAFLLPEPKFQKNEMKSSGSNKNTFSSLLNIFIYVLNSEMQLIVKDNNFKLLCLQKCTIEIVRKINYTQKQGFCQFVNKIIILLALKDSPSHECGNGFFQLLVGSRIVKCKEVLQLYHQFQIFGHRQTIAGRQLIRQTKIYI